MKVLIISIIAGIMAGIIDIIPMIIRRIGRREIISAFLQYFFIAIIIINIDIPLIPWWLEGSTIAVCMALPIIVLVSKKDKKAVYAILIMALLLGSAIGIAGNIIK